MSQVIPINICKLRDINDDEVEKSVKVIERRKARVQLQRNVLKSEVDSLNHENVVLDKQANCTESLDQRLKNEISKLKTKTEDLACCLEEIKWKLYKAYLLKEFESQTNENIGKQKFKYEQIASQKTHPGIIQATTMATNKSSRLTILTEKAEKLMQEIGKKKKAKEKVDPKLLLDIQILEKRNTALTVRYQRQVHETESRYRQSFAELNGLQKLLVEKNALLTNT